MEEQLARARTETVKCKASEKLCAQRITTLENDIALVRLASVVTAGAAIAISARQAAMGFMPGCRFCVQNSYGPYAWAMPRMLLSKAGSRQISIESIYLFRVYPTR